MNATSLAQSAYTKATSIAPSLQDVEYRAFGEVTRRLKDTPSDSASTFPALAEAIHLNLRLWSILARDVTEDANGLPEQLRAQIFYLYEFTRTHSSKVLSGDADTTALVDINTAIMRGLRGEAPATERAQ